MARSKIRIEMLSYGIYDRWDRSSKALPKVIKHTRTVPARIGIEFGYILNIKKARGKKLNFRIAHPPFQDDDGNVSPPFEGEVYVRTNDWDFYLGDTVWEPAHDKIGAWRLTVDLEGRCVADKTFEITMDSGDTESWHAASRSRRAKDPKATIARPRRIS